LTDAVITQAAPQSEFSGGWRTLLAAMMGLATGTTGLPFYTFGLFVIPLGTAFHWSQTEIASSSLVKMVATMIIAGYTGRLADKMGVRRIAIISLTLTALSLLAFVLLTPSIWSYYALSGAMAICGAGTTPVIWTRGVSGWFQRYRGIAIGLTLIGTGISSIVAPPIVDMAIRAGGWRMGYVALAAMTGLVGVPLVIALFKEAPERAPVASAATAQAENGPVSFSLSEALHTRQFWQLWVSILLAGGAISVMILYLIPMLIGSGMSRGHAVSMASMLGMAVIVGRLSVGWLLDRVDGPKLALVCFLLCACAVYGLATLPASSPFILLCVLGVGYSAGAEIDLLTFLSSRYFGLKSYTEIGSWLFVAFIVGSGIAPPLAGFAHDQSGGYTLALYASAGVLVAAALLFGTLGKYRFER
jgi:predicted MFS family arabinose efflux permease